MAWGPKHASEGRQDGPRIYGLASPVRNRTDGLLQQLPFPRRVGKGPIGKKQLVDVVILRREEGSFAEPLPDGLDDLKRHNLITFKPHLKDLATEEILAVLSPEQLLAALSPEAREALRKQLQGEASPPSSE
jgi:hypothetical protein